MTCATDSESVCSCDKTAAVFSPTPYRKTSAPAPDSAALPGAKCSEQPAAAIKKTLSIRIRTSLRVARILIEIHY